jgi:predicted O-methyltransferase YrrM
MFSDISSAMKERMDYLEKADRKDRDDGTPALQRLRQVPPETGRFIALMLAASPDGTAIEIGTSAGYSAMWLALACRETGRKLVTFEVLDEKVRIARETLAKAGIEDLVQLVHGDAREHVKNYREISFCFLDCEKEYYLDCYEAVVPRMVRGGLLVADNAINLADQMKPFLERANHDPRVDAVLVPYKSGELVCRKR